MLKYVLGVVLLGGQLYAANYTLDVSHTGVTFKIKHLVISTVNGRFDKFEGNLDFDEKTNKLSKLEAKIDLDSINTNDPKRDEHLKGADFFGTRNEKLELVEAKRFMTFVMKEVKMKGKKFDKIIGDLTLNGITKPVTLAVDYKGAATDPWGNEKVVFSAMTKIVRKDFGITWNKPLEKKAGSMADKAAGLVIGEEVDVIIEGEANKSK
jgi:polyisoprenoid-binding protein YceI